MVMSETAVKFLIRLFNRILDLLIHFNNKVDVQSCSNRRMKMMSHTLEIWERIVEARLRREVRNSEHQCGFILRKSSTHLMFTLRVLMEKHKEERVKG